MPYKVFLVEDEVTTREGIRDNVDWQQAGFILSGEASDGEIALPQIEASQPDVLITDIKMPFMDGLQLCKIVREHMPWMKIIIISGYNDFQYAQTAISLGVSEYLLKPVSVQDLQAILAKVKVALEQETRERAYLKRLRSEAEDNLSLMREKFLLRLVTGGESSIAAIEQSHQLGLNILSACYQVIILQARPGSSAPILDYPSCQQIEKRLVGLVTNNPDVLLTKKGMGEFVIILKGENEEQLSQEAPFLANLIREEVEKESPCRLVTGTGSTQRRLGDLHRSFAEALAKLEGAQPELESGLTRLDHAALRRFLETGQPGQFDSFFHQHLRLLGEAALRSPLLKHYVMVDIALAAAQFISDLGGDAGLLFAARYDDGHLASLKTIEHIQEDTRALFRTALAFRDSQAENDRGSIVQKAKAFIDSHASDSNLSLNQVAAQVNFSPNHFSAVFSAETGITFRDYLTRTRIEQAKKLLRSTRLKCAEVAYQCGYNDPHYFSLIFRKVTGQTPQQFRAASKNDTRPR